MVIAISRVKTRKKPLSMWRTAIALLVATVLAVMAPVYAEEPQYGGTLRLGLEADFPGFDPLSMGTFVDRMVSTAFYETLLEIDEDGHLQPLLATSIEASDDATVYTVELRQGVQFHDGTPFNAEAVAANFRRLMDPANGCRCAADVTSVERVEVTGPYTVEFHLKAPSAAFPAVLADVPGMQPSPTA